MTTDEIPDTQLVSAWRRDADYGGCQQVCSEINDNLLYNRNEIPSHVEALISEFDGFFEHNSLPSGTILYRGCVRSTVDQVFSEGTMIYPAFMSTSNLDMNARIFFNRISAEENPTFLKLILTERIQTIDASSKQYAGIGEGEFVLPRGIRLTYTKTLDDGIHELLVTNP